MKKPYSAVTVLVERLTSEEYEENDYSGLPDLIEAIKLQNTGPAEASRAIRKKLKYGAVHRQLRALTLLDALISNAGARFQRSFADEALLERLRIAATDGTTDADVKAKLKVLFAQWAREYKDIQGLQSIANLYKQFPRKSRTKTQPLPVEKPPSPTMSRPTSVLSSSSRTASPQTPTPIKTEGGWRSHKKVSSKSKGKRASFNLEKEKPALNQALANSSRESTNLSNSLKLINREKERPSEKPEVRTHYENCKSLHTTVLRYIQHVESEQWLGSLIQAHEQLSTALDMYNTFDKPIDEDSDSEDEWNSDVSRRMGDLAIDPENSVLTTLPRPKAIDTEEVEDPDSPFGDQHAVLGTPGIEEDRRPWKVI